MNREKHAMNSPRSTMKDAPAMIRPDEKREAPVNARLRGSWKKLSSRNKRKHHRR
jgi:hypothetical protein